MTKLLIATLLLIATAAPAQTTKPIGANRVINGSFERGGEGWPFMTTNGCNATGEVSTEQARDGSKSFKITNKTGFAPHVYGRATQVLVGLEPFTTYRISCYAKGKNVGICWIGGSIGWGHRQPFPRGTYDWTYVETTWTTSASADDYPLLVATESQTEALWVDDIKFEPISMDKAKRDEAVAQHQAALAAQQKQLAELKSKIAAVDGAEREPVLKLGMTIARRYIDRVLQEPPVQSWPWSGMQLAEVDMVLKETAKELEAFKSQKREPRPLHFPTGGKVTIRDGLLYTDTTAGKDKPWFFYGMGHFSQIMRDLPAWHDLGVTMIQDGTCGPSAMNQDGTLRESAKSLLANLDRAATHGIKTDFLLSPHYFPEWAWNTPQRKDLAEGGGLGFINFNIDHPLAKDAVGRWAEQISKALKDKPALLSVCLSNEPAYDDSGKTKQTLPLYRAYLREIHRDIAALNALYGTSYKRFEEIKPPTWHFSDDTNKNRAFYDWHRFNKKHFADWHAWMRDIVKKHLPDIPVHAKIMVFQTMGRHELTHGVDPELFCEVSDIAGCDAYAFPAGDYSTYDWRGHEFWYDLLHSFRNQPVFNSENHIIPDGTGPHHIPMSMTRAQFWQGALHHQPVTTTWVWEEAFDPSLIGSIYFRPANVYGAGRAFVDLGHFAEEVAAINKAPPRVALLYSQPSIFWEEAYAGAIQGFYTHLSLLGEKTTFVSERMLQEGRGPKVDWIVLTRATHVEDATIAALQRFVASGGKLIYLGEKNLAFDQYHRGRVVPADLAGRVIKELDQMALHQLFNGADPPRVLMNGKITWNVEHRLVEHEGATLMPMINFAKDAVTVKCPSLLDKKVTDLLSGEALNARAIKLEPMVPRLLRAQ